MSENCKVLVDALPSLVRDEKNPEDIADSSVDHAPDSCRYGLKSKLGSTYIPEARLIAAKIAGAVDHTARYIQELKAREHASAEAGFFRRRPRYSTRAN